MLSVSALQAQRARQQLSRKSRCMSPTAIDDDLDLEAVSCHCAEDLQR